MRPDRWAFNDCDKVYDIARGPYRVMQQMRVRPHPELDCLRVSKRREPVHWNDAAEGAGPGIDWALTAGHETPRHGADPIRPDHQVGLHKAAIGKFEPDGITLID
jgi:hypothetical protein